MDLSTRYLGLTLRSPLVASACPATGTLAGITELAKAGVGAVVLPSLFEEQLRAETDPDWNLAEGRREAQTYFRHPDGPGGPDWPRRYLNLITQAAETGIRRLRRSTASRPAAGRTTRPPCRRRARPRSS